MPPIDPDLLPEIVIQTRDSYLSDISSNTALVALNYVRATLDETIRRYVPYNSYAYENDYSFFSNTTKLEPFWNVTQTRAESVRNAEAINNNTLPTGVYSSKNMSMYASIKY
jgi:hypothetical protein